MTSRELLQKLKSEGWTLEPDRIYPTGCITFNRMGKELVEELKQAGILKPVKGCPNEWELNPITAIIGEVTEPETKERPLGFRRFLSERKVAA